jgi:hypothetical protein
MVVSYKHGNYSRYLELAIAAIADLYEIDLFRQAILLSGLKKSRKVLKATEVFISKMLTLFAVKTKLI